MPIADATPPSQPGLQSVPADVLKIVDRLFQSGFHVYLVGGALRDMLLGTAPKDWDLATDALPEKVMEIFPKVLPLGLRHGTVMVRTGVREVEVTTYGGPAEILGDLGRRDFTVNALALSYPDGVLLDPFDGRIDLDKRTLRAVGDARARFREDPLRTVRAARFLSVYGFLIENATFEAMASLVNALDRVAIERIREELFKTLMGPNVREAMEVMRLSGLIQKVLPELEASSPPDRDCPSGEAIHRHVAEVVHWCPPAVRVRIAALLHSIPRDASAVMNRWKASARLSGEIGTLTRNQIPDTAYRWTDSELREYLARIGPELLPDALALASAHERSLSDDPSASDRLKDLHTRISYQIEHHVPFGIKDLAVNGDDVVQILNIQSGPVVGDILRRLYREVLKDPNLNNRETLIDLLRNSFNE